MINLLRILTGKTDLQIKLKCLRIIHVYLWNWYSKSTIFKRGSDTHIKCSKKLSSQWQKSILCDRFILYSPFNVLTLAFDRAVLYANVAL